jgi:hypothetical protein
MSKRDWMVGTTGTRCRSRRMARLEMPPGLRQFHGLLGPDLLRRMESFDYERWRGRYTLRDTPGLFGWLRHWL